MIYDLIAIGNPVYDEITTPYISTKGRVLSGCSTNAALVAKRLGVNKVGLIGSVGKDYHDKFISDLEKYGIDPLQILQADKTGGFKLFYFKNGDRTLETLGIANKITFNHFTDTTIEALKKARFILLGPILQEIDKKFIIFLKNISKAKIFLDPQGLLRQVGANNNIEKVCDQKLLKEIIKQVDFVKPNEYEAELLTKKNDPLEAVKELKSWNKRVAIVTLGDKGSVVSVNNITYKIPPYSTFAKDPTGAGDSYAGSFIAKQLENNDILESALFASAASSIMVEYTGPDFIMSLKEVNRRMEQLKKIFK